MSASNRMSAADFERFVKWVNEREKEAYSKVRDGYTKGFTDEQMYLTGVMDAFCDVLDWIASNETEA